MSDQQLPQQLIEGFQRLVAGDYAYRLPRSFARDEEDTIAVSFNAVAEELKKIIRDMQASEQRLNRAVDTISAALLEVSAGNLDVHVERDYQGDQVDVLAFLVDTTIGELRIVINENQRRNEEIQSQLEVQVRERTLQLTESEKNFRLLFDASPIPMLLLDTRGHIVLISNQAAADLFCLASADLPGKPLPKFFESDSAREILHGSLRDMQPIYDVALQIRVCDGDLRWVVLNTRQIAYSGRLGTMITLVDLTQQKKAETELERLLEITRQQKNEIEEANRAKSVFLANMSHELRTPLNAILGFSELMTHDSTLSAGQRENLATINRSGEHLLALINDVLELSKIEAGRTVLRAENLDLFHLLRGLEEMFHLRAGTKGLALIFQHDPEMPHYIRTDQGKLRQVLINLLSNAVKFTSAGHVMLRVSVRSADTGASLMLHCEVEDTGPGIAAEERTALFEAFVQTASGRKAQEGTGLGLAISREFVRVMGGELAVRSEVGHGSTFEFAIPIEQVALSDLGHLAAHTAVRRAIGLPPGQPAYRVLIAEDVQTNRQLLTKFLLPLGLQIQEAANGQEAIEIWERWQPQVILMDMRMPVMDGHEAVRRIKATAQGRQTVVIALTATAFEEDRSAILAEGCDGFMRKPFRESELLAALTDLAGVRFMYEDGETGATEPGGRGDVLTETQVVQVMARSSIEWLTAFEQAALDGDVQSLTELIEQLRPPDRALADRLTDLTQAFQLDQLLNLVRRALEPR